MVREGASERKARGQQLVDSQLTLPTVIPQVRRHQFPADARERPTILRRDAPNEPSRQFPETRQERNRKKAILNADSACHIQR